MNNTLPVIADPASCRIILHSDHVAELYDNDAAVEIVRELTKFCRIRTAAGTNGLPEVHFHICSTSVAIDGHVWFGLGHVPRLLDRFRQAGIRPQIQDDRDLTSPACYRDVSMPALSTENRRILDALVSSQWPCHLLLDKPSQIDDALWLICKIYRRAPVVIFPASQTEATVTQNLVQRLGLQESIQPARAGCARPPALIIGNSLRGTRRSIRDRSVIVFMDLENAVPAVNRGLLMEMFDHRPPIALIALEQTNSCQAYRREEAESIFGRPQAVFSSRPADKVRVIFVPSSAPAPPRTSSCLEGRKQSYWHNTQRNDLMASVAMALVDQNLRRVIELGMPGDLACELTRARRSVAVAVEAVEHGQVLANRLHGWSIPDQVSSEPPCRRNEDRCIFTLDWAKDTGVRASIVVRASGGDEMPARYWLRADDPEDQYPETSLIDFLDGDHMGAEARARVEQYRLQDTRSSIVGQGPSSPHHETRNLIRLLPSRRRRQRLEFSIGGIGDHGC